LKGEDIHQPLVITLSGYSSPEDLEPLLSRVDPESLRSATCVVFKTTEALYKTLASKSSVDTLISLASRITAKPAFLLYYYRKDKSHRLTEVRHGHLAESQRPDLVAAARQQDLLSIVHENQEFCYLRATEHSHFITPSGRHCSIFLRVGDAIRSVEALDRVAFWLLPEVAAASAVFVDSWTISPVLLRCLHLLNSKIPFDCLAGHPRSESAMAAAAIDRLISPLAPNPSVACVISVTSSGSFAEFVRRTVRAVNRPLNLNITSIYAFAGVTGEFTSVLCELPDRVENFASSDDCSMCQTKESVAISVDPRLYYFRDRRESEKALTPSHFSVSEESYSHLSSVPGVLRVHRDDNSGGSTKHHTFNVDVPTLLGTQEYRSKCVDAIASLKPRPSVIVAPGHESGKLLASIAAEVLRAEVIFHETLRPTMGLPLEASAKLRQSESILVVDDVLNTGKRMRDYNRALREHFGHLKSVAYFAVVARTESVEELRRIETALRVGHQWQGTISYLEKIFLPRWDSDICPWCKEFQFLSLVSESMARPPSWLQERLSRLSEREQGIVEEPLLLLPGVQPRVLAPQSKSVAAGTGSMTLLFEFASALQQMRTEPDVELRLSQHATYANVFASRNLIYNYDETLLQAITLRLVRDKEWGEERRGFLHEELKKYAAEVERDILLGELLLATTRNCVPRFSEKVFSDLFESKLQPNTAGFWNALNSF
jgi:orotate phosphoribosyltransferase